MGLKAVVILEGAGGELDRAQIAIEHPGDDPDEEMSIAIQDAIETWTLSVGDTIRIVEEQS